MYCLHFGPAHMDEDEKGVSTEMESMRKVAEVTPGHKAGTCFTSPWVRPASFRPTQALGAALKLENGMLLRDPMGNGYSKNLPGTADCN